MSRWGYKLPGVALYSDRECGTEDVLADVITGAMTMSVISSHLELIISKDEIGNIKLLNHLGN